MLFLRQDIKQLKLGGNMINRMRTIITTTLITTSFITASQNDQERLRQLQAEQMRRDAQHRAQIQHAQITCQSIPVSAQMQMNPANSHSAWLHNQNLSQKK